MTQSSLWQDNQQSSHFAEICNALYERELRLLANRETENVNVLQRRLKSLSYYINKTANLMTQVNEQGNSPLTLDVQNATWSSKQALQIPLSGQVLESINSWYLRLLQKEPKSLLGLVIPVLVNDHVVLDCIDGINADKKRLRTNVFGWFSLTLDTEEQAEQIKTQRLLKPNKKTMLAACAGHRWQNSLNASRLRPIIPSLRELLLSCAINWQNFKRPRSYR
ncbi:MAG: hypothetical protein QF552_07380 [Litorilituus sp.]|nr:hypothetical protein [Litorilituus sp.]